MKHIKKLLPLYLYEELNEKQMEMVENHLKICSECNQAFNELRSLHKTLSKKVTWEPGANELQMLRTRLSRRLQKEVRQTGEWNFLQMLLDFWSEKITIRSLAWGLTLILSGFFVGLFTMGPVKTLPRSETIQPLNNFQNEHIINVDLIRYNPQTKKVTIRYKVLNEVMLQGKAQDASIQNLLAYAIRQETHPGRRLQAVKALGTGYEYDKQVEEALIYAMEKDSVDGVRLKAIKILQNHPINAELKQAFIRVLLKDKNPAMRIEALHALSKIQTNEVNAILKNAANDDQNEYIRYHAGQILEKSTKLIEN